jgi:hypothetical protein
VSGTPRGLEPHLELTINTPDLVVRWAAGFDVRKRERRKRKKKKRKEGGREKYTTVTLEHCDIIRQVWH